MNSEDIMQMTLREVSNMLEQRFDENLRNGAPIASACIFGTSPTTGKRMVLKVILTEDEKQNGVELE